MGVFSHINVFCIKFDFLNTKCVFIISSSLGVNVNYKIFMVILRIPVKSFEIDSLFKGIKKVIIKQCNNNQELLVSKPKGKSNQKTQLKNISGFFLRLMLHFCFHFGERTLLALCIITWVFLVCSARTKFPQWQWHQLCHDNDGLGGDCTCLVLTET